MKLNLNKILTLGSIFLGENVMCDCNSTKKASEEESTTKKGGCGCGCGGK